VKSARKIIKNALKSAILSLQPPAADRAWIVDAKELEGVTVRWPTVLEWPSGWLWVEPLFHGFRSRVRVKLCDIPQRLDGAVVVEFCRGERVYRVAINFKDYPDLTHLDKTPGAPEPLDLEFKMQFQGGGYGVPNIVPGGFVSDSVLVDWYARKPRRERDRKRFSWDVYGRFGLNFATAVRTPAITALTNQSRFRFFGGGGKVRYPEFLNEVAHSRVCLDLPGNGPFCFRLVNYMAVGACIVSVPHSTVMPVPMEDRKHIIYTRPDMSDLVDICEYYVNNESGREAAVQASRDYYRRYLYWRSLSDYYLRTMLDRLPA
jgi:hypothetical protein